jgi:hypothetical protein
VGVATLFARRGGLDGEDPFQTLTLKFCIPVDLTHSQNPHTRECGFLHFDVVATGYLDIFAPMSDFQTLPIIAKYMVGMLPSVVPEGHGPFTVLEPTPGDGNIVHELTDRGYDVTVPVDYFLLGSQNFDAVVMNPPFSAKDAVLVNSTKQLKGMAVCWEILTTCMLRSDIVIALVPWYIVINSDKRLKFLQQFGLVSVTSLPRKAFPGVRVQTCILELRKGYSRPTVLKSFTF